MVAVGIGIAVEIVVVVEVAVEVGVGIAVEIGIAARVAVGVEVEFEAVVLVGFGVEFTLNFPMDPSGIPRMFRSPFQPIGLFQVMFLSRVVTYQVNKNLHSVVHRHDLSPKFTYLTRSFSLSKWASGAIAKVTQGHKFYYTNSFSGFLHKGTLTGRGWSGV